MKLEMISSKQLLIKRTLTNLPLKSNIPVESITSVQEDVDADHNMFACIHIDTGEQPLNGENILVCD